MRKVEAMHVNESWGAHGVSAQITLLPGHSASVGDEIEIDGNGYRVTRVVQIMRPPSTPTVVLANRIS